MRYFRLHWREPDNGGTAGWGTRFDFWEVDQDGRFTRSVHAYDGGQCLRYDELHEADGFGQLPEGPLEPDEIDSEDRADLVEIDRATFELAWSSCSGPPGQPVKHPLQWTGPAPQSL